MPRVGTNRPDESRAPVNAERRCDVEESMIPPGRYPLTRLPLLAAVLCVLGLVVGAVPSSARTGAVEYPRSDDLDVITADRDAVRAELARLDERYSAQREQVESARAAMAEAEAKAAEARQQVESARKDLEAARLVVASYATEAYMRPPAGDTLRVLSLADANDAGFAHTVMELMTESRQQVVDELVARQAVVARAEADAEVAAGAARRSASEAEIQLVELDRLRAEQQKLAKQLDERLDDALAEAAALAAIDQAVADQLAAQELALRSSAPSTRTPREATTVASGPPVGGAPATSPPTSGGGGSTSGPSGPSGPTAPTPTTAPNTTIPSPPPGVVTWSEVTSVGGIYVHTSIADDLRGLLNAATAAGFSLRGGGYRDPASQIATRRANCGPTYYDIYVKPSSQCTPPTAIPGRSMHERGLAIDFTSSGVLITSRSNPAFTWLSNNAGRYGFRNLPSEPWHWSTTGT